MAWTNVWLLPELRVVVVAEVIEVVVTIKAIHRIGTLSTNHIAANMELDAVHTMPR